MLSKISLDNHEGTAVTLHEDSSTSKRSAVKAQGLVGVGALRVTKRVKATAHGGINETSFEDGRSIKLDLEVISTVGVEDMLEELRKMVQPMLETLDYGPALLKWTEGASGLKKQMLVKLDSEVEPILSEAAAIASFPVAFFATDPRAYSQTLTTQTGSALTATEANSPKPSFVAGGPANGVAVDGSHIYWATP